ncbi:MAG: ABC transporter permease [Rhodobiaceae bacterium]|nr:ABC transporter permease [Rhodobiaceae bacterium]MCC0018659.1 ABC transporter permease [Rhodobiaceae bacterium]MCC0051007.1 ABC transporter permease [Rhodobiaceae bacterium]MCC0060366.1 ABC transporter permease [Rhodobiaceae bacterium]
MLRLGAEKLSNKQPPPLLPLRGFRETAYVQSRVLDALVIRYLLSRYGRDNIGFVWLLMQPILLTLLIVIFWTLSGRLDGRGINVAAFALSGFMPLSLWRFMSTGAGINLIQKNRNLLYHRDITYLDIVFATQALEFIGTTAAMVIVTSILIILGVIAPIQDYYAAIMGWLLMGALGFGFGCLIAGLTAWSKTVKEIIPPIQLIVTTTSGAFFMVAWLPEKAREVITYLPLAHAFEGVRAGFMGPTFTTYYDFAYGFAWALGVSAIGLWLITAVWENVDIER